MAIYKTREDTLAKVAQAGFRIDPYSWRSSGRFDRTYVNDPFTFTKTASDGGSWRLSLDYRDGSAWSYNVYDGRLRGVEVEYIHPDNEVVVNHNIGGKPVLRGTRIFKLITPGKWDRHNPLWETLRGDNLRAKFHDLLTDVEGKLWAAVEEAWVEEQRVEAHTRATMARREARSQPLTVVALGDGEHGHGSPWRDIAYDLADAGRQLHDADGITDVIGELAKLHIAYEKVIAALTPDGAEALINKINELAGADTHDHVHALTTN